VNLEVEAKSGSEAKAPRVLSPGFPFFCFFAALGFELRAYTLSYSTRSFLVIDFLEIGSHELFAIDCLRIKILLISAS
jgi:hypothetical protein